MNKKNNDLTIGDENISYIRETIMQIKNQLQMQDELFTNLFESNKQMTNELDILDRNIDALISRTEKDEAEVPQEPEVPTFQFNMENRTITYRNQLFQYSNEYLYGHESIDLLIDHFNQTKGINIFPQGIDYVDSFLNEEKKSGDKYIIVLANIQNPKSTFFYFPLNNITDLSPTQGWRIFNRKNFQKQIAKLNEYKNDIYPQGFEYCKSILNDQSKKNGYVHIVARNNDSIWTRYYFVSHTFRILQDEQLYLVRGKNELRNELKNVEKNKQYDDFPQGVEFCEEILNSQYEIKGEVLVLGGESNNGRYSWYYFQPDQFEQLCNIEWWIKEKNKLEDEIRLIDEKSRDPKCVYVHGKEYYKKLIQEQIQIGGAIHMLVRNSIKNYWFYLKA